MRNAKISSSSPLQFPCQILEIRTEGKQMKKQVDRATKNEVFQLQERARSVFEYKQQGNQKEKKDRQALDGEVVSAGLQKELKGLENLEF